MIGDKIQFNLDGFVYIAEILTFSSDNGEKNMKLKILSIEDEE